MTPSVLLIVSFLMIWQAQSQISIALKTCWPHHKSFKPYMVGNGFTCCNNTFLQHPLLPKNPHWRKCMLERTEDSEDDLSMTMWKVYLCELSLAGNFSEQSISYEDLAKLFTTNYPPHIKEKVLAKASECIVSEDADPRKKLEAYEDCFWKTEEKVCLEMAGVSQSDESQTENKSICEPVESLKNPEHSFLTFIQPCCKGEELPYPLLDIFMDFERFDVSGFIINCSESLRNRIQAINPQAVPEFDKNLRMCDVACVHAADGFDEKYNSNFSDLLLFKMKSLSKPIKEKLLKMVLNYDSQYKIWGTNQTVSMKMAGEIISKQDETSQIMNYCKFHFEATAEAYRGLYEYCYNEEYGIQFRDDTLKSIQNEFLE